MIRVNNILSCIFKTFPVMVFSCLWAAEALAQEPYTLPHTFPMEKKKDIPEMTVVDANGDGYTWEYGETFYTAMVIESNPKQQSDDWLILPAVTMTRNNTTRVTWKMRTADDRILERLAISVGQGKTIEDMTTVVMEPIEVCHDKWKRYSALVYVPEDGDYNIGFHALSDADSYLMFVDSVELTTGPLADVPRAMAGLTVEPAEKGGHSATLTFDVPAWTNAGVALTNKVTYNIYRNGTKIGSAFATAGKTVQYMDREAPNGFVTYKVTASNAAGESDGTEATAYVGYDTPKQPGNVVLSVDRQNRVVLQWDAAEEVGWNGAYVDPERVQYIVTRYDEYADRYVSVGTSRPGATSYTVMGLKANEEEQQIMTLTVRAADLEYGLESKDKDSNPILIGEPYTLPYEDHLDASSAYEWYRLNMAVGSSTGGWQYGEEDGRGVFYVKCDYPTGEAEISSGKIGIGDAQHPMLVLDRYMGTAALYDELVVEVSADNITDYKPLTTLTRPTKPESKWQTEVIDLQSCKGAEWISLRFIVHGAPAGVPSRDYQMIGPVRVVDAQDGCLAVTNPTTNEIRLPYNGGVQVKVQVENLGATTIGASDYKVVLLKGDDIVAEAETREIAPFASQQLSVHYACAGPGENDDVVLTAHAECPADGLTADNEAVIHLTLVRPILPEVSGLTAEVKGSDMTLSWNLPAELEEQRIEDFDSYEAFTLGEEVLTEQGYTIYFNPQPTEQCGSGRYDHAAEPIGWLVFDNRKAGFGSSGAYAPHSGSQCLVAFDGKDRMDTWLITPQLSGKAQTVSFYTGCLTGNWGAEEFNVLYSVTGTAKEDFIQINQEPLTERQSWDWTLREVDVPEGARFFAIQVVSQDKMGFKIDDLRFKSGSGKVDVNIEGYNVYEDNVLASYVTMPECQLTYNGPHTYGVSIVTDWGEGPVVSLSHEHVGIVTLTGRPQDTTAVYNLNGQRVNGTETTRIYIKDGRVVVKE